MNFYDCCKDCEERHPLCHGHCEKKAKADAEFQKAKNALNADKAKNEYSKKVHERIMKRRNLKK